MRKQRRRMARLPNRRAHRRSMMTSRIKSCLPGAAKAQTQSAALSQFIDSLISAETRQKAEGTAQRGAAVTHGRRAWKQPLAPPFTRHSHSSSPPAPVEAHDAMETREEVIRNMRQEHDIMSLRRCTPWQRPRPHARLHVLSASPESNPPAARPVAVVSVNPLHGRDALHAVPRRERLPAQRARIVEAKGGTRAAKERPAPAAERRRDKRYSVVTNPARPLFCQPPRTERTR